jgi:hypothetical protein
MALVCWRIAMKLLHTTCVAETALDYRRRFRNRRAPFASMTSAAKATAEWIAMHDIETAGAAT